MTQLPSNWPALVAAARMAKCDQRAYRDRDHQGVVRFYPSALAMAGMDWFPTAFSECACIRGGDTRLPDAEAARIWATRPEGVR